MGWWKVSVWPTQGPLPLACNGTPSGATNPIRFTPGRWRRSPARARNTASAARREPSTAQDRPSHLGEAGSALGWSDVLRRVRELGFEAPDVGHADAVGK